MIFTSHIDNICKNSALRHIRYCNCNCNLFTHWRLRSSWELVQTCPCVPDRIGIWKCWFLRRGENRSTRRKTSRSKGENQQQTQPTYGVDAGIWTRATLVGGERSHHCATLAPHPELFVKLQFIEYRFSKKPYLPLSFSPPRIMKGYQWKAARLTSRWTRIPAWEQ